MGKYELSFKRSVRRDFRAIPPEDVRRILKRIDQLADDPRSPDCTKLTAQDLYRVRVGRYRILYEIHDKRLVVVVIKVAHRSRVYRK